MKLDRMTRREFLQRAFLGLAAMSTWRPGKETRGQGDKETGGTSPRHLVSPSPSHPVTPSPALPRALSAHEYATVAAIAALIVPTDDDPGATEAGVADTIDRKASRLAAERRRYAAGVRLMDDCSARLFGRGQRFVDLTPEQQLAVLKKTEATLEMRLRPVTSVWERAWRRVQKIHDDLFGLGDGVSFFRFVREDVMAGFYTNPVSWAMLGYVGPPQPRGYPHYEDCPVQTRR